MLDDDVASTLDDGVAAMSVLQWHGKDDAEEVKVVEGGEQVPQNGGEGAVGGIAALDGEARSHGGACAWLPCPSSRWPRRAWMKAS